MGAGRDFAPAIEFGIASACLGAIALMLFFLPILSIPIAICGAIAGAGGVIRGTHGGALGLRWSLIGFSLCAGVFVLGVILSNAPSGEVPSYSPPIQAGGTVDRPYVPPPAAP